MFDNLPADASVPVDKNGLDKSSSKDLRADVGMNSSTVQREIAAQESDRQLSFAGDNSFANQGADPNTFQTFMASNSHRGANQNNVGLPIDKVEAVSIAAQSLHGTRKTGEKPGS